MMQFDASVNRPEGTKVFSQDKTRRNIVKSLVIFSGRNMRNGSNFKNCFPLNCQLNVRTIHISCQNKEGVPVMPCLLFSACVEVYLLNF